MEACLKCGHKIVDSSVLSCPKCGVVFEKLKRLVETRKNAERVSRQSDSAMHSESKARLKAYEMEYSIENLANKREYGVLDNLSFGIVLLLVIAVCLDALGLVFLNNNLQWMPDKERIYILIAVGTGVACSAAAFLSIAVFLNMSKEIAKNTWATKEYLKKISEDLYAGDD
jgi:DNA-directed RNA polymerase subunit M/transcription elongation factor TFIIS